MFRLPFTRIADRPETVASAIRAMGEAQHREARANMLLEQERARTVHLQTRLAKLVQAVDSAPSFRVVNVEGLRRQTASSEAMVRAPHLDHRLLADAMAQAKKSLAAFQ